MRFDTFRGSGPGGQKRNKTSSAVRATHEKTGLWAICDDGRDQHKHKQIALQRLRHELTVKCRERIFLDKLEQPEGFELGWMNLSPKDERYLVTLGFVLDVLLASGWVLSRAAEVLGTSTARVSKLVTEDELAFPYVNKMRESVGLKTLRT